MTKLEVAHIEYIITALSEEADSRFNWTKENKEAWIADFSFYYFSTFGNAVEVIGDYLGAPVAEPLEENAVAQLVQVVLEGAEKAVEPLAEAPAEQEPKAQAEKPV